MSDGIGLSLDEFIRKKKMENQFGIAEYRRLKKYGNKNIDEVELNASLDEYIRESGVITAKIPTKTATTGGKFDRKSMRDEDDDSSDDEHELSNKITALLESDVEMKDEEAKTDPEVVVADDEDEERDQLGGLRNFQTVESRHGLRVRSQQWRMLPENLVDRPEGVKRLEFLPLDENERYKRVLNGRVGKRSRSRNSSISTSFSRHNGMSASSSISDISAQGVFIEKGPFTYKIGDRNGDGSEGLIGIERKKHIAPAPPPQTVPVATQPITVDMNWSGFFEGMEKYEKNRPKETADPTFAAQKLLKMLIEKREKKNLNFQMQQEIAEIQGRPLVVEDRGQRRQIITFDGDGIDLDTKPDTTKISLSSRFA